MRTQRENTLCTVTTHSVIGWGFGYVDTDSCRWALVGIMTIYAIGFFMDNFEIVQISKAEDKT